MIVNDAAARCDSGATRPANFSGDLFAACRFEANATLSPEISSVPTWEQILFFKLLDSSSLLGPVDSSFRALSGRLKFTVRRHKFNQDSFS